MLEILRIQLFVFCCFAGPFVTCATLGNWALERHIAEYGKPPCGMFMHPYMGLGFFLGAAVGVFFEWRIRRWLARQEDKHKNEEVTPQT
jgi:hypothetical protein